jgi:hypothetical protein
MAIPPIKTSANLDLSASNGAGKSANAHANINASAHAQNQNSEAFQQVNQQLGRNNSQGAANKNSQTTHGNSESGQNQGNPAQATAQGSAQVSLHGNGNHNGQQHHQRNSGDAPRNNGNQGNQGNNGNHGVQHENKGAPQSNQTQVGDGGRGNGNRGNGNGNAYAYGQTQGHGHNNSDGSGNGNVQGNGNGGGNNKGGNPLNININFSANVQTGGNNRTGSNNQTGNNNQSSGNNQNNFNLQTNVNVTGNNNQVTARGQINNQSSQGNGQGHGNAHAYGHLNHSSEHGHGNHSTQGNINYSAQANTQRQTNLPDLNLSLNLNRSGGDNGNHNGIVRSVLNQVLRQNDIYLNQNVIRQFVNENFGKRGDNGNHYGAKQGASIPPEITQIVRTIRTQIINVLDNTSAKFNGNIRVTIQNSPELSNLIHGSKHVLLQNFGAKTFVNLNLQARMFIASELILRHLSKTQYNALFNQSAKHILNGLLLARGFAITADKFFPRHDIFSAKKFPLPYNVPPVVIRNLGNAVKALIVEARLAQTPKDLEAAVEKFVRGLSGKNNLDALASAVKLAEHLGLKGNVEGEADTPEKIAELVKFLVLAGDKALQTVADAFDAAEGELLLAQNADNSANTAETSELERNYEKIWSGGDNADAAEGALRRQLEFNPFFQNERAASAFENPSEASRAQDEFSNRFQTEIQQWLESGNHRFVKDIELEKPVGIVVERGTSGFFMADAVRFVLVRDGSVQGWHFLKSFLVK